MTRNRVFAAIKARPGSTSREIAADLGAQPSDLGFSLLDLRKRGRITRTGRGGQYGADEVFAYYPVAPPAPPATEGGAP